MKRSNALHAASAQVSPDPLARLLADLPAEWQGDVLGPGIDGWGDRILRRQGDQVNLGGLPHRLRTELAWMVRWQFLDGVKINAFAFNRIVTVLEWTALHGKPVWSLVDIDMDVFSKLNSAWRAVEYGRLPTGNSPALRGIFRYSQPALVARLSEGPWWSLDFWSPRCDPRIPLREREPKSSQGCHPGRVRTSWLRDAVKWHLGTALEAGTLTWSTSTANRLPCLILFDRWLSTLDDPTALTRDLPHASAQAAAFRHWASDAENHGNATAGVSPRAVNNYLLAVSELMAFIAENREECRLRIGPSPWDDLADAHAAIWRRQNIRERRTRQLNDEHYVDDHALSQITAHLPKLGEKDPQAMRMLLLQILTGRRASEIIMCDFDCLSPPTDRAVKAAEGEQVARFRYAQSKIDRAPDTILVDVEVVAVIEEQQQWIRDRFPGSKTRYLFSQIHANAHGTKPYGRSHYYSTLLKFSEQANITDGKGRPIQLSKTHRFRHTRITRLAELGLPVHVLQRYAGHSNPTMTMHYVARREEHSEQAFLATRKFKADGTAVTFSREDHDGMQLFNRADRFLPHGYCLLPPLQTCDKGNACLTCSVFVTDSSHLDTLQRQLDETEALIQRQTSAFQARHGRPMPEDNVWLVQRTAERDALVKLLASMQEAPGRPCQGAGSPTAGPTPITIDTTSHRRTQP
ncbi:tyrosine-type recombinase/integrase [Streptomyces tendae]